MDPIPREKMGNATSLFNLMRNIGGSIGIATTGTMLARHSQATDRHARRERHRLRSGVADDARAAAGARSWPRAPTPTTATSRAYAALFGMVQRQATMVSFVGLFQLLGVLFLALVPLVLLMKRPGKRADAGRGALTDISSTYQLAAVLLDRLVLPHGFVRRACRAARSVRSPDRSRRPAGRSARR